MSSLISLTIKFLVLFISSVDSCQWSPKQCGCARTPPSILDRIVGGTEAIPHSWPWIVSVRALGRHICGGVLITHRHLLTAAHCFPRSSLNLTDSYSFAMGHHSIQETNFVSTASRIVIHASYNFNGRNANDIALVELNQTVNFENDQLGFICLPFTHMNDNGVYPPLGRETWVVGWGTTNFEGSVAPVLMQVSVPVTLNQGCLEKIFSSTQQLCAGYNEGGKDSCQGDSGGPLVVDNGQGLFELIGLVSFGEGCAESMKPGIYTRVSAYIDWIKATIDAGQYGESDDTFGIAQALISSNVDYQQISYILLLTEIFFLI